MRTRGVVAAVVGACGAGMARALDVHGLLPGVHESEAVRGAMGPGVTAAWLVLAGGLAALAASTRPVPVGTVVSLLVSGLPEMVSRHDPEAFGEPGAITGALVQLVLLLTVVALAVLVGVHLRRAALPAPTWQRHRLPRPVGPRRPRTRARRLDANPRAPPASLRLLLTP